MAELRCPMCSKANPDTREVCQFCGARLRPLVLPMTGELNLPDDWIKAPPPAEKPAAPAQPAQGADDWLGSLRNSGTAPADDVESFESAGAGNPVDDWLAKLRAQDEAEEAEVQSAPPPPGLPASNWLNNPGSSEETFVHRPQAKPNPDPALPSWLQVTDDDEPPPNFGQAAPEEQEPEPALPDWLSGGTDSEPAAPALPDWMSGSPDDTFAAPPPSAPAQKDELPAWLSGGSSAPEPEAELPSWMRSNAPDDTFAAPAPNSPAPKDELPAWLSGGTSEPAPTPDRPSWMTEEAPPPAGESALPDWLSSSTSAADETFVRPPKETKPQTSPALPEWLSASGNEIDDTISSLPPEGTFTGGENKESADLPDWLAGAQPATPDWLSAASGISDDTISLSDEPSYSPNQGTSGSGPDQSTNLPDWLTASSESPAAAQPPDAKPGSSPLPDWLSEPVAKKPGSSSLRPAKPITPEIPDWLASSADETSVAKAPAKPTVPASQQPSADKAPGRAVEGITDWLSGDSSAQMPASKPAAGPEGGQRPLSTTGWLRSLTPSESSPDSLDWLSTPPSPSTPSEPPAQPGKAVVGSTDWLASTEGSAAPSGDLPDWLSPSAPAPATPAPSTPTPAPSAGSTPPSAPKDKAVVGSTDWFASTDGAPSAGVDIPDWLSASAPATAPTPPPSTPAAPPLAAPKSDKALVGSTDWLAENQGTTSNVGDIPDWLAAPSPSAPPDSSAPRPSAPPAPKDKAVVGSTDWFNSTEGAAAPSADMPDWLKGPVPASPAPARPSNAGFGTTDWLTSLGSDPVPGAPEPPSATPAKKVKTGWLTGPLKAPATADQPSAPAPAPKAILGATDWLDSLAAAAPTSGTGPLDKPKAPTNTELPDWLGGPVPSPTGTSELPDWVADSPSPTGVASAPPVDNSSGKSVVGTTDWLKSLAAQQDKNAAPAAFVDTGMLSDIRKNDVSDLDWLSALQPASPSAAPSAQRPLGTGPLKARPKLGEQPPAAEAEPAQSSGDLPAWLAALKPTGIEIPRSSTMDTDATLVSHAPLASTAEPASEADLPDWMRPAPGQATPAPAAPTRQPVRAQPAPAQPSSAPFSAEETMVSARSLPALSGAQSAPPSVPAFSTPVSADNPDMITANLPAWMRALRPLDARATAREPEPDHEETAGPLAGMRGVLPAESVITMAGKPGVSVMGFVLTDAHTRLADRLRRLVQEEASDEGEIKPRKSLGINFDVWRLVVAVALFAMVFLPFFQSIVPPDLQAQLFAPPPVSPAVQQFAGVVDKLQAKQIAVVAIEYEPANRGEMDPVVTSVIAQLMQKRVRVVMVSSSPTGAGVADDLMRTTATKEVGGLAIGKDYINLGFIPGGPAGLRQFAVSPFATVHNDFSGNAISTTDWADLASLQKVGLVVVASSSADGVQNWLQQVQPQLAVSPPFTAISSAAAEPLVLPYTQGKPAQLAGVVTGLSGAIQYDTLTKRAATYAAPTAARWFSFGFGLYAIAGVLVLGSLLSVLSLVLSRRPAPAKAGVKAKTRPAARTVAPVREPEPEPVVEEEAPPEMPAVSDSWDPTETVVASPAPKPAPKASATKVASAKASKSAPAKKAPAASKTTATKGKPSTAAGKAKPKAKSKSVETRVETETAVKAKPRMRKV